MAHAPGQIYQSNQKLSLQGEDLAAQYFQDRNYNILARRYRCRFGEIDLIGLKERRIAFIEVKARSHRDYGDPLEAITAKKCLSLFRSAQAFLDQWLSLPDYYESEFWGVGVLLEGSSHELECIRLFLD